MELLCPAGNFASLKAAIKAGADAVYLGLQDDTNARSFAGLNFTPEKLPEALSFVHQHNKKLHLALNTFAKPGEEQRWYRAIDLAAKYKVDALIVADLSLLKYASLQHPQLPLHLSVQASASNAAALTFYKQMFNIQRAVLPRVLSIKQIKDLARENIVDLEVFAFGSLCIMSEGRCHLSSWVTGQSPNTGGSCSPAKFVRWQEDGNRHHTHLNNLLIDTVSLNEKIGYPVICKGRYQTEIGQQADYLLSTPTSLSTLDLLPQLHSAGVVSLKIEGRQRSPAYVEQVTQVWRQAIDAVMQSPDKLAFNHHQKQKQWSQRLTKVAEGQAITSGPYNRDWQ